MRRAYGDRRGGRSAEPRDAPTATPPRAAPSRRRRSRRGRRSARPRRTTRTIKKGRTSSARSGCARSGSAPSRLCSSTSTTILRRCSSARSWRAFRARSTRWCASVFATSPMRCSRSLSASSRPASSRRSPRRRWIRICVTCCRATRGSCATRTRPSRSRRVASDPKDSLFPPSIAPPRGTPTEDAAQGVRGARERARAGGLGAQRGPAHRAGAPPCGAHHHRQGGLAPCALERRRLLRARRHRRRSRPGWGRSRRCASARAAASIPSCRRWRCRRRSRSC